MGPGLFLAQQMPDLTGGGTGLGSLYDIIISGGPVMVPIGISSVIALAFAVDRWIRLRSARLGTKTFSKELVSAVREGGAASGLVLCEQRETPLARVLAAGLRRASASTAEMEKAVEDAGAREVRQLSQSLRPLVVVAIIAPLLGLLGTVWGMIVGFSNIAGQEALGNPKILASAVSQALVTTAAGLVIAIPVQTIYFYFRSRIDRFVHVAEATYEEISKTLAGKATEYVHP
ncbi:MAG: MotA/TolQ/ExbB proton channel family protein [Planctomycetes bacterium]|nr:MotA/TolQ/ExbB proton channel family protein [Planctomycetota bacterium]MBI3845808.1 MotA/TolQ/ExbB proton channel family protein [Planctomycetota bacterium]